MGAGMREILRFERLEYGFNDGNGYKILVKNTGGVFCEGRIYAVIGQEAKEKAVLLSLLSGLERPHGGKIFFKGTDIESMGRGMFRRNHTGMLLQAYPCVAHLTALQNAMLSIECCGSLRKELKERVAGLLEKTGLDPSKYNRKASGLTLMEQQAVGLVRALAPEPSLLLIEEMDWDSDPDLMQGMTDLLMEAAHKRGVCVVMATDSKSLPDRADEVWGIKHGILLPVKT